MAQELTFNITEDVRRLKRPTAVKDFRLSFGHADQGPTDVVIGDDGNIVQGRYGDSARQVFVNVVQGKNNEPVDITGYLPEFNGCIPDAEHIVIDNWDGVLVDPRHGRFRFDFPIQAFTVAGSYKQAYFRLVQNGTGKTLATLEFDMQVLEDFVYSNIVPQDYVTPYLDMINKLKDAYTNFVGKTQDSFDQAKKRLDDIMSTVEDKADTVEQRLKTDEQALAELSKKIDDKGLFTKAEADAFKQAIVKSTARAYATLQNLQKGDALSGTVALTAGYSQAGDGGGATYAISSTEPPTYYERLDNGLYAALISEKPVFEQFGAKGDGATDDTTALNNAFKYSKTTKKIISAADESRVYSYQGDLILDGAHLDAFGTIKGSGTVKITNGSIITQGTLDGFNIVADGYHTSGRRLTIHSVPHGIVFRVVNGSGDLYNINDGNYGYSDIYIDNLDVNGDDVTGLQVDCPDATFSNFLITNCHTAIQNNASNSRFINCYAWINGKMTFSGTTYFATTAANYHLTNCTNDSYQTTIDVADAYCTGTVNGLQFLNNNDIFKGQSFTFLTKDCRLRGNAVARLQDFDKANNEFKIKSFSNILLECYGVEAADYRALLISNDLSTILQQGRLSNDSYARCIDNVIEVQAFLTFDTPVASAGFVEYVNISNVLGSTFAYGTGYAPALYESDGSWYPGVVKWEVSTETAHNIKITCPISNKPNDHLMSCSLNLTLPVSNIVNRG